jgi:hypothetical protein
MYRTSSMKKTFPTPVRLTFQTRCLCQPPMIITQVGLSSPISLHCSSRSFAFGLGVVALGLELLLRTTAVSLTATIAFGLLDVRLPLVIDLGHLNVRLPLVIGLGLVDVGHSLVIALEFLDVRLRLVLVTSFSMASSRFIFLPRLRLTRLK